MTDEELKLIKTEALLGGEKATAWKKVCEQAERYEFTPEQLMRGAARYLKTGQDMEETAGADFNDDFWEHYEILTGERPHVGAYHAFFRCAC